MLMACTLDVMSNRNVGVGQGLICKYSKRKGSIFKSFT